MDHSAPRTHRLVVAGKYVLRYAITDLSVGDTTCSLDNPATREARLRAQVQRWAVDRVDIVQLREKQLESGEIYQLACVAMDEIRKLPSASTQLVINGRPDVAAAAGAHGVHLTSRIGELSPAQVRRIFRAAGHPGCLVTISCHTPEEAAQAHQNSVDLILFGPVFEKRVGPTLVSAGTGLDLLQAACREAGDTPVLALGGVQIDSIPDCLQAGVAGIASIRMFQ